MENVRIEVRNIEAWILRRKTGRWACVQSSQSVEGAAYREDFAGDVNKPADLRKGSDGGVSVKLAPGRNFHFWPKNRVEIDPADIAGVVTSVEARIVSGAPDAPCNLEKARVLLGMGADYWLALSAQWDACQTNGDAMIGRFKYLTPQWQRIGATTLTATDARPTSASWKR